MHLKESFVSFIESTDGDLFVSTATWDLMKMHFGYPKMKVKHFRVLEPLVQKQEFMSFGIATNGLWVLAVRGVQTYLWWKGDGEDWMSYSISEQAEGWVTLLMIQGDLLWFSSRTEEEYNLWRIDPQGNLLNSLQSEMEIKTGAIIEDAIVVGGDVGHVVSYDNGETWSQRKTNPETACLINHNGYLYACTQLVGWCSCDANTSFRDNQRIWIYGTRLFFSDVYSIAECPVDSITTQTCLQRWEAGVVNGGFSEREDTDDVQKTKKENQLHSNGCSTTNRSGLLYVMVFLLPFIYGRKE